jgi:predicted component of type VI protein secretion system
MATYTDIIKKSEQRIEELDKQYFTVLVTVLNEKEIKLFRRIWRKYRSLYFFT